MLSRDMKKEFKRASRKQPWKKIINRFSVSSYAIKAVHYTNDTQNPVREGRKERGVKIGKVGSQVIQIQAQRFNSPPAIAKLVCRSENLKQHF